MRRTIVMAVALLVTLVGGAAAGPLAGAVVIKRGLELSQRRPVFTKRHHLHQW